jgi:polyvinyl alcohol dehydrogenase (cytochrome)
VDQLDAASGKILNTFVVQTPGCGGSVWGSPAIDEVAGTVYFATGNHGKNCTGNQYTSSLVELNASDLSFVASWKKPKTLGLGDDDFGSTPTLFSATIKGVTRSMVGLVNKNGVYYAFDRANIGAGPLWTAPIAASGSCPECGQGSISSSSYDGHTLYVAGGSTTIIVNGVSTTCAGSIDALDPATGNFIWRDCLSHPVLAPVTTLPGLVVVGSGPLLLIMSTTDGSQLFSYQEISGGRFWGPATVSNGVLYQGNIDGNFYAFMPK